MKSEEFFKLSLHKIFGIDEVSIDKYFKNFRRNFSKLPQILNSLENDVVDCNGNILEIDSIDQDIEKVKKNFQNLNPKFLNFFFSWMYSWIELFLNEIELQLDYAKEAFDEYKTEKQSQSIDSKRLFRTIHYFSIHAANISKLIDKVKTPSNSLRSQLLSTITDKIDFDIIPLRQLRNHLEHFEERLDAWHYLNWGNPILDMNIFNSTTKGLKISECLRALDIEKDIIYILGEKFELNLLFKLILEIESTIKDKQNLFG